MSEAARLADALIDLADYPMSDVSPQFGRNLREAAALLRTQAAALAEREWRPIETAPCDVSPVLLGNADEGWREQGFYDTERREWWAVNTNWTDAHGMPLYPTHWLPLPAPPLAAAPSPNKEQPVNTSEVQG